MKLTIKNKEFDVKVVRSDEDLHKGLRGVDHLDSDKGMLFMFDEPQEVEFEMDGTLIDLDIIFIDEDKEIISVEHGKAGEDEDYFVEDGVKYVLEIAPGHKFKPGMEVDFDEGVSRSEDGLHVIDSEGNTQGVIQAGTRIFSRKNTKMIIKLSKIASESNSDKDYKKLGKKLFLYLDIQESNDEDYVEGPKKEKED